MFLPRGGNRAERKGTDVTDQERQKAEELISRLETAVGQIFPRDSGNAGLIASMIQSLNGLRSVLGVVRPH
jgi:D-serine dehydratase